MASGIGKFTSTEQPYSSSNYGTSARLPCQMQGYVHTAPPTRQHVLVQDALAAQQHHVACAVASRNIWRWRRAGGAYTVATASLPTLPTHSSTKNHTHKAVCRAPPPPGLQAPGRWRAVAPPRRCAPRPPRCRHNNAGVHVYEALRKVSTYAKDSDIMSSLYCSICNAVLLLRKTAAPSCKPRCKPPCKPPCKLELHPPRSRSTTPLTQRVPLKVRNLRQAFHVLVRLVGGGDDGEPGDDGDAHRV